MTRDWERFIKWLIFNVLVTFLPVICVWIFRNLAKKPVVETISDYSEIMFVSIMICATAIGDIVTRKNTVDFRAIYVILLIILIIGFVLSLIIYGGLRLVPLVSQPFELNLPSLDSVLISVIIFGVVGIISEVLLTYTE